MKRIGVAGLTSIVLVLMASPLSGDARRLIPFGSDWRYDDKGEDLGTKWREPEFDYSLWPIAKAKLGYGAPDLKTQLSFGEDPGKRHITYYFRKYFVLDELPKDSELTLNIRYDDGFALYLNGKLLKSANVAENPKFDTRALKDHESTVTELYEGLPTDLLTRGKNYLAVEVHQDSPKSGDMGFDLELSISPITDRLRIKPKVEAPPIKEWLVSDSFPNNDEGTRLKKDYLNGEGGVFPDPSMQIGGVKWTAYSTEDGLLDFTDEKIRLKAKTNIAIYAHVYIQSPVEQGAILYMGSDDGCAAWLNGTRVHFNDIYRGIIEDKDEVPIHLLAGWNRLLTKVSQGGGLWSLKARLARIDGQAIEGLTYSVKNPLTPQQWQAQQPRTKMDIMPGKNMAYINNGPLALWFGNSADCMLTIMSNGRRAGTLRAAVAQFEKKGIGYKKTGVGWSEANKVKDIRVDSTDPNRCIVDVTVEQTESEEMQRKYEATYRFTIGLGATGFESRLLSLKNTDTVGYEVRGYWHKLQPPVSDAEPRCHDWIAAWVSEVGGIGAFMRDEDDFVLALRSKDGRPYGDVTRALVNEIKAGFQISPTEPSVFLFVSENRLPEGILQEGAQIRATHHAAPDSAPAN